jgi:alkyl hydroperoxide reductase subunit AhpF
VSTGARWREMNVPGEKEYRAKGVAFCPHCDGPLFKGKKGRWSAAATPASRRRSTLPAS